MADINNTLENGPDGACGAGNLLDKIEEQQEKLIEDATDTVNRLASKGFGGFVTTAFTLFTQFIKVGSLSFGSMVGSMISSSIGGTINTLMGLSLNTAVGSDIMLKYLAAKTLKELLEDRIRLGENLTYELLSMIALINALLQQELGRLQNQSGDLSKARKHVQKAAAIIGGEIGKIQNTEGVFDTATVPISDDNLDRAIKEINEALKYITFGKSEKFREIQKAVNRVTERNGLQTKLELGPVEQVGVYTLPNELSQAQSIGLWTDWIGEVSQEMESKESFNKGLGEPNSPLFKFISEILSILGLPNIIKTLIVLSLLRPHVKALSEHMPIMAAKKAKVASSLLRQTGVGEDLMDLLTKGPNQILDMAKEARQTPRNYEDGETYQGLMFGVKIQEAAILMLPSWAQQLQKESGLINLLLRPALDTLQEVSRGLGSVTNGQEEDSSQKRFNWQGSLEKAKIYINGAKTPGISATIDGRKVDVNPRQIQREFNDANFTWAQLEAFITQKTFDEEENEAKIEPGTRAYKTSQGYLATFAAGSMFIFDSTVAADSVRGLQGVRTLVNQQLELDYEELNLVNKFINQVESVPLFGSLIKPSWDTLLNSIQDLNEDIYNQITSGNLSQLVGNATLIKQGLSDASQVAGSISECLGSLGSADKLDKVGQDYLSFEVGGSHDLGPTAYKEFNKEVQQDMDYLRDKSMMLKQMKASI